jgi:phytoene dehydrogenase-like protein
VSKRVAIIGAGHNGLICGSYLAANGFEVTIFEKNAQVGGLCVNEKPFAQSQALVSSVASYYGMLRREIVQELDLETAGLEPYLSDPIEVVLLDKDQFVFTPRESQEAQIKLDGLNEEETRGWQAFWSDMQKAASLLYPLYFQPDTRKSQVVALLKANNLEKIAATIFSGSLEQLMNQYLSLEGYKTVAATCTPGFANLEGSVFGCIHHGTASTMGEFGAWGQVKGGMGKITQVLARQAQNLGVKIEVNRPVKKLLLDETGKEVKSLFLEDGSERKDFHYVIAATDAYVLFGKLLNNNCIPEKIHQYLKEHKPKTSAAKLHLLLSAMPSFATLEKIGHNHKGVIVMAPSLSAVKAASQIVPLGQMPKELMMTMAFPHLDDASLPQDVVLTIDVHYLPATINGAPWSAVDDEKLLELVLDALEAQCPDIRNLLRQSYILSPYNLKERFHLESLSCWHLPMTPDYLFEMRSLPGYKAYETPYANLFMCGSGTYPAGNVTGVSGRNAAQYLSMKCTGQFNTNAAPLRLEK